MRTRAGFLFSVVAAAGLQPVAAQARLTTRPNAEAAQALAPGITTISSGAYAYSPPLPAGARPGVMVLFHGAGGDARRFLEIFRSEADRRGLVLLSIQSADRTWDIVLKNARSSPTFGRAGPPDRAGADARRVDAALKTLFKRVAVDPRRLLAAGFSDGASYALSIGLGNDQLFTGIVALAPGFSPEGTAGRRPQRIAIAHGQYDRILSFARAEGMARDLDGSGYPVQFLPFPGDHSVDRGTLGKALDFVLGPAAN